MFKKMKVLAFLLLAFMFVGTGSVLADWSQRNYYWFDINDAYGAEITSGLNVSIFYSTATTTTLVVYVDRGGNTALVDPFIIATTTGNPVRFWSSATSVNIEITDGDGNVMTAAALTPRISRVIMPTPYSTLAVLTITLQSVTTTGTITMGSATVDGGVFSIIKGETGSDPTFSITQSATEVTLNETVGDINITAVDDITITSTGDVITLVGNVTISASEFYPYSRTEAELKALSPDAAGSLYYDSTNLSIIISTGTGTGAFAIIYSSDTTPNGW